MEFIKGQIVMSRTGRDACRWYVVLGAEQGRLLLANGEKFGLLNPKRKNIRHLMPTSTLLCAEEWQTDDQLKQVLAAYVQSRGTQMQGG